MAHFKNGSKATHAHPVLLDPLPLKPFESSTGVANDSRMGYFFFMPESPQFQHKLSQVALRDHRGLILIESTCLNCGSYMTVSIPDGSLHEWEMHHGCGKVIPFRLRDT